MTFHLSPPPPPNPSVQYNHKCKYPRAKSGQRELELQGGLPPPVFARNKIRPMIGRAFLLVFGFLIASFVYISVYYCPLLLPIGLHLKVRLLPFRIIFCLPFLEVFAAHFRLRSCQSRSAL